MLVVVPFIPTEWTAVGEALSPDSLANGDQVNKSIRKHALEILGGWRARFGSKLPLAADITEIVLRAKVFQIDELKTNERDWWKAQNSQLLLCMAILRFINFLQDVDPRLGDSDRTLRAGQAADLFQVPDWVVRVRHRIAHQELPNAQLCIKTVDFCLNWIYTHYWSCPLSELAENVLSGSHSQKKNETAVVDDPVVIQAVDNLLQSFELVRNESFGTAGAGTSRDAVQQEEEVLNIIKDQLVANLHAITYVLVSEGHLLLNKRQLKSCNWNPSTSDISSPPAMVQQFWQPVLGVLFQEKCMDKLIETLINKSIDQQLGCIRAQIISWIKLFLDACEPNRQQFVPNDQSWANLFRKVVQNPQIFGFEFVERMALHLNPPMKKSSLNKLKKLMNIYKGQCNEEPEAMENALFTVRDAQDIIESKSENEHDESAEDITDQPKQVALGGGWFKDEGDWSSWPIGLIPGQTCDTLDLTLKSTSSHF